MCLLDLQADVTRRTMREGARQYAMRHLNDESIHNSALANQFADWYVWQLSGTRWSLCEAWSYWWLEVV